MRRRRRSYYNVWPEYVTVSERQSTAKRQVRKLKKDGLTLKPLTITGRKIARQFWGEAWCRHLESFSDFSNRLPRGRSYVRNGLVLHMEIHPGRVDALVSGTAVYRVHVDIKPLHEDTWNIMRRQCAGHIGTMLELLQGRISSEIMALVTNRSDGLFPLPDEIRFSCDCPDMASMCKHVAAVLYGVGARLDEQPELLFTLRNVDARELIGAEMRVPDTLDHSGFDDDDLSAMFGVEIDGDSSVAGRTELSGRNTDNPENGYPLDEAGLIVFSGALIKHLRKHLGLSRDVFAKMIRTPVSRLRQWEHAAEQRPEIDLSVQVELETLARFGLD